MRVRQWIRALLTGAWMLWSLSVGPLGEREWAPLAGFETFKACVDARERLSAIIDEAERDGKRIEVYSVGDIMLVQCFPASVDPRQPR